MRRLSALVAAIALIGVLAYAYRVVYAQPRAHHSAGPATSHDSGAASSSPRSAIRRATAAPHHPGASTSMATPAATASPTPTPAATASATTISKPTATATDMPSATATRKPTATATDTPSATATTNPTASATATAGPTTTPTPALQLGDAQFSLFTVNPRYTAQQVSFTVSAPARVEVRIAQAGAEAPIRTWHLRQYKAGTIAVTWRGRDDHGRPVPEGGYTYTITATDARGHAVSASYGGLGITYKRIVVSLSKQQLWAFDGSQYVLSSLVTTGNPALPTPLGHFAILARYSPFTFHSPWPYGSQYYYAPSYTNFALLFDNRGYYVHDAPWRSRYGPGTNTVLGTPGQDYTGTHGCVNVPYNVMAQLFQWATIGTEVVVVP